MTGTARAPVPITSSTTSNHVMATKTRWVFGSVRISSEMVWSACRPPARRSMSRRMLSTFMAAPFARLLLTGYSPRVFLIQIPSRLRQGKRAADTATGQRRSGGAPRSAALPGHHDHTQPLRVVEYRLHQGSWQPEPVGDLCRGPTSRRDVVEHRGPRAHSHDLIAATPPGTPEPQAPMR